MVRFEYRHKYIPADNAIGSEKYNDEHIKQELNKLGEDGWELVSMTPDWEWVSSQTCDAGDIEAPYSYPNRIEGWYCTFKRTPS